MTPSCVVLIPVKSFSLAKGRLRQHLGEEAATALARSLATAVVRAAHPRSVVVVTNDHDVSEWAVSLGARVVLQHAEGLNAGVHEAYQSVSSGTDHVIIAHGDLADPQGLGSFAIDDGITLFSDHHGTGTNVLALPSGLDFAFHYGPDSLRRHVAEAERLQLKFSVVSDSPWAFDIDEVEDLR